VKITTTQKEIIVESMGFNSSGINNQKINQRKIVIVVPIIMASSPNLRQGFLKVSEISFSSIFHFPLIQSWREPNIISIGTV